MKLLSGNSNRPLAEAVAAALNTPLTRASVRRFSDMEIFVEIHENVRGEDVFIIQSTSYPANDNLMELLVALDALKRGSARRITADIPYYGYARQDRKSGPRTPISAKLVANLITSAGADRVLTLDLHAGQIEAARVRADRHAALDASAGDDDVRVAHQHADRAAADHAVVDRHRGIDDAQLAHARVAHERARATLDRQALVLALEDATAFPAAAAFAATLGNRRHGIRSGRQPGGNKRLEQRAQAPG